MDKILLLIMTLTVTAAVTTIVDNSSSIMQKYLEMYGYVGNNSQTEFSTALSDFQERYNLPVDGSLNNETKNLIARPRCQQAENEYRVHTKWNKTHLSWYLSRYPLNNYTAYDEYLRVFKKAFEMWENASTLEFEMMATPKSDITISFVKLEHQFRSSCMGTAYCGFPLDGPGNILAHAYFPQAPDNCREIHFDSEENWYTGDGKMPYGYTNLLMTAVHEIGHSLGLAHCDTEKAIMFPWYQQQFRPIHHDDITGLEVLYGRKNRFVPIPKYTPPSTTTTRITATFRKTHPSTTTTRITATFRKTPPSTTTTRTTTTTHKISPATRITTTTLKTSPAVHTTGKHYLHHSPEVSRNLCEVTSPPHSMFLAYSPGFPSFRLYIIVKDLFWKVDIKDKKKKITEPEKLKDYLPNELVTNGIDHIFQTGTGNLLVASKNRFYSSAFPSLQIDRDIEIPSLPPNAKINALFQTYAGKSYVFYNNASFIEFNGMDFTAKAIITRGRIEDAFPDIPNNITAAFRYMDGNIYFFKENTYFKYNEFQRRLIEVGDFSWNMFDIPCPSSKLLDDLKDMLSKLISFYE